MRIEILSTESLGARGLCCLVETRDRRILIDPGIALGYRRHGLLPHPFQVAFGVLTRQRIVAALAGVTDIVFSHFHGDHVPLADANPFQLALAEARPGWRAVRAWGPAIASLGERTRERRAAIVGAWGLPIAEASEAEHGPLRFSGPVPHGEASSTLGSVMMTRIEDAGTVFVHASDIQLIESESIDQLLAWKPDLVLASGPPLYLHRLDGEARQRAWRNALRLASEVDTLILDHHLLRARRGARWLEALRQRSPGRVLCGADYAGQRRRLLEAWRRRLYQELPVPAGWHADYARGVVDWAGFLHWGWWDLEAIPGSPGASPPAPSQGTE